MQLTQNEIDGNRLHTLLTELNEGKEIDMKEMDKLCFTYDWELKTKNGVKPKYYLERSSVY